MLEEVVVQGLMWESYEAVLWPPCPSPNRAYHMTNEMSGEKTAGEERTGGVGTA